MFHVVFATKDRKPFIDPPREERLFPYMGAIIRASGGRLYNVNGGTDHLHLLASLPPNVAAADVVREVKSCTSKWVHETFPERSRFRWQRGYSAFSVSQSQVSRVAAYIDRQKEHHARTTFREEYERLLRRHGISPESTFLWV